MSQPSNVTMDDLRRLAEFRLSGLSLGMTYLCMAGSCGYTCFACIALWMVRRRYRLFMCVSGLHGMAIVPNSTYALLTLSTPFSIIDVVYSAYTLAWNSGRSESRHWMVLFGLRYIPAIAFFWLLLTSTTCIWPFPAHKMRIPWLWNLSLLLIPLSVLIGFLFCICRASALYARAWDRYLEVKQTATSVSAPDGGSDVVDLYRRAASACRQWALIGTVWSSGLVLCLFIVGVNAVNTMVTEYCRLRDQKEGNVQDRPTWAVRNTVSLDVVADINQTTTPTVFLSSPGTNHSRIGDQTTQHMKCFEPGIDNVALTDISESSYIREPQILDVDWSGRSKAPTIRGPERVAALKEFKSLMTHSALQLFCLWVCMPGSLATFAVIFSRLKLVGTRDGNGQMITIFDAAVRPQVIEKLLWLVLAQFYLGSVLIRIRQNHKSTSPPSLAAQTREEDAGRKYASQVGVFLTSTPAGQGGCGVASLQPLAVHSCPSRIGDDISGDGLVEDESGRADGCRHDWRTTRSLERTGTRCSSSIRSMTSEIQPIGFAAATQSSLAMGGSGQPLGAGEDIVPNGPTSLHAAHTRASSSAQVDVPSSASHR
ncbi:hypothetical protein V8E36_005737 [Tilletia maclaganii]